MIDDPLVVALRAEAARLSAFDPQAIAVRLAAFARRQVVRAVEAETEQLNAAAERRDAGRFEAEARVWAPL